MSQCITESFLGIDYSGKKAFVLNCEYLFTDAFVIFAPAVHNGFYSLEKAWVKIMFYLAAQDGAACFFFSRTGRPSMLSCVHVLIFELQEIL